MLISNVKRLYCTRSNKLHVDWDCQSVDDFSGMNPESTVEEVCIRIRIMPRVPSALITKGLKVRPIFCAKAIY
jgi:hypothetical protein